MAVGKPIIMAARGDAATLVSDARSRIICEPEHPLSIAQAVESLASLSTNQLEAMGKAGRAYYCRNLSLATGVERFEQTFAAAAN